MEVHLAVFSNVRAFKRSLIPVILHFLVIGSRRVFSWSNNEGTCEQPAGCNMHEEVGGEPAESMAETRRVEAAAGCAAELSDVSNPSIKPAFPHGKRTNAEFSDAQFADAVLNAVSYTHLTLPTIE